MARKIYRGYARDGNGTVLSGATVSVYLTGTSTVASIYAASSGGTAVNSTTTDSTGLYSFYVDYSDYAAGTQFRLTISKTGYDSVTYDEVECLPPTFSDAEYDATWDGVTTIGPSKNAVYDAFQLYLPLAGGTMSGNIYMANLGSIGESGGTRLSFDYTNNAVVLNGGTLGIGNSSALSGIYVQHNISGGAGIQIARSISDIDADTIGLVVSVTESATAASTKQKIGIWNTVVINNDNYARSGNVLGLYSSIVNYSTNTTTQQIAGFIRAVLSGTGTVTINQGVLVTYGIIGGAATITGNYGLYLVSQKDAGTITTDHGLYIGGGFATTANYGVLIADQTTAASNYAIYTGAGMVRFGGEFGCNGATPRAKATVNAACSDLTTAVALLNQIRTALINNGICQ